MTSPFTCVHAVGAPASAIPALPDGYNRLIHGDCLAVMRALPDACCNVIYLDPPFFSNQDYHLHNGTPGSALSFTDRWEGGLHDYLYWLQERLAEMRRLLREDGALFVHLDWHAVHYVKVMLDHLFGYRNFQNEFIWYYSGGGASTRRFARKHDTILYYTKSATNWTFHADRVREPYKWTSGQRRADGSARDYDRGKLPDDVWQHHTVMPWADEHVGYPTQKPLELVERLLLATTDVGDVVGDFFCGSGTTAVAAQRLERRWLTSDVSRMAVCLAAERLAQLMVPGCIPHTATRSRARAQERFAAIEADATRVGLAPDTLAACADISAPGFAVECWDAAHTPQLQLAFAE